MNDKITYIYLVENCYDDPTKIYIGKTKTSRKGSHRKKYGSNNQKFINLE
jgi:hypothetical protein